MIVDNYCSVDHGANPSMGSSAEIVGFGRSVRKLHLSKLLNSTKMSGIEEGKKCAAFAAVDELVKVCF